MHQELVRNCNWCNFRHRVRLGEWNTETEVDCATTRSLRDCNDPPVDVSAEQLIPHPQYTERNYNKMHDIALIRLSRDVRFTGKQLEDIVVPEENNQIRNLDRRDFAPFVE